MNRRGTTLGLLFAATIAPLLLGLVAAPAGAAPKCRVKCDKAAPTVVIATPTANATVAGGVTVSGSSSDGVAVQSVSVSVDGGPWATASGTGSWSWGWSTAAVTDGPHNLVAKAVDTSGNVATTSVAVNVANGTPDTTAPSVAFSTPASGATVSQTVPVSGSSSDNASVARVEVRLDGGAWQPAVGTGSWSWSWDTTGVADGSHTLTARVTDTAGNMAAASRSVMVANSTSTSSGSTGTWTSPEGVKIDIQTTTGGWTPDKIYAMLTAGARDLSKVGPDLKIVVQDTRPTLSAIAASSVDGRYTAVSATIQLDARSTSTFANRPDDILTHEYGHVWFNYYAYMKWQGSWSAYLSKRWTAADGSTTLATDSRTGSSYIWTPDEIAADDYRLLFGSDAAIAQRNASLNQQIPDPRSQAGLRDWLLSTWAG